MEVVGVVASGLALIEVVSKIGVGTFKLKALWQEIQDAPEEITRLIEEIELIKPILVQMASEFQSGEDPNIDDGPFHHSIDYCRKAVDALEHMVDDLSRDIDSAKLRKRNWARAKVGLSRETTRKHMDRLHQAMRIFALSQQSYMMAMMRRQPARILESVQSAIQVVATRPSNVQPRPSSAYHDREIQAVEDFSDKERGVAQEKHMETTQALVSTTTAGPFTNTPAETGWRKRPRRRVVWSSSYWGIVTCTKAEQEDALEEFVPGYRVEVRLPRWLATSLWDFQVQRDMQGWNHQFCVWRTRPESDEIFQATDRGDLSRVRDMISRREASLLDRTPTGDDLLLFALRSATPNLELVNWLYACGYRELIRPDYIPWILLLAPNRINGQTAYQTQLSSQLRARSFANRAAIFAIIGKAILALEYYSGESGPIVLQRCLVPFMTESCVLDVKALQNTDCDLVYTAASFYGEFQKHSRQSGIYSKTGRQGTRKVYTYRPSSSCRQFLRQVVSKTDRLSILSEPSFCGCTSTPLLTVVLRWFEKLGERYLNPRLHTEAMRNLTTVVCCWLEDLQACGVNLETYGRNEKDLLLSITTQNHYRLPWEQSMIIIRGTPGLHPVEGIDDPLIIRLLGFAYGPRPEDWKFYWDMGAEAYAGEFWHLIEHPPLPQPTMPGSWTFDL
ncbi:hypothetical protein F4780DRAFT_338438 [Xylariomycetidae sp. FL0641]|nr:hypothetical protein F4780DRAFT_338438 [Xylariomycetidae sp. FL0641]